MNEQRTLVKMTQTIPVGSGKLTCIKDQVVNKHQ